MFYPYLSSKVLLFWNSVPDMLHAIYFMIIENLIREETLHASLFLYLINNSQRKKLSSAEGQVGNVMF